MKNTPGEGVPPTGNSADVLLVLRPVVDPLAKSHGYSRDADYRLKLLLKAALRAFGFRCIQVGNVTPAGVNQPVGDRAA